MIFSSFPKLFFTIFLSTLSLFFLLFAEFLHGNVPSMALNFLLVLLYSLLLTILIFRLNHSQIAKQFLRLRKQFMNFSGFVEEFKLPENNIPTSISKNISELIPALNGMGRKLRTLSLEKELFETLLLELSEGVICVDRSGKIIFQNRSVNPILAYPDSQGQLFFKCIINSDLLECLSRKLKELSLNPNIPNSSRHLKADTIEFSTSDRFFEISCQPIAIEDQVEMLLIIIYDKTDAWNTKKLRENFLQNASHELKTPITSIRGYAETLEAKTTDTDEKYFLSAILRNVERMQNLIEDMTAISSFESKSYPFHAKKVNLKNFFRNLMPLLEGMLSRKSQALEILHHPSEEEPVIEADPLLLEHLFMNLISNASRYAPEGSSIYVRMENISKSTICIQVIDRGPGINPDHSETIFNRFFRSQENRSRQDGGTGLGLSIVKQIVRIHGGKVTAENRAEGGAVFSVYLPI